jgi:ribosomal protein S18 acetylase RimI-like enzyme
MMQAAEQIPSLVEDVVIRKMIQSDLPALEWDGEYTKYRDVYLMEFERSQIGSSVLWVADKPGTGIIGQLFVQMNAERTELANGSSRAYMYAFRIRPPYRGSGLGTRMMAVMEEDLLRRKFSWVTLNVGKTNYSARRLYARLGYRVVAHEPGRWSYHDEKGILRNVEEPAWRMEKFIGRAS